MSSVLLVLAVSGCVSTVDGTATRAADEPAGQLSLLEERDLEPILLDVEELNEILDSDEVEITHDLYETTDDSDDVSDPYCLGAVFTAEEPIYSDTGYSAVLTRLGSEPDEYGFTIELTGVIMGSQADAEAFVDDSADTWSDCSADVVSLTDGADWFDWQLEDVKRDGGIVSQPSALADGGAWECQHSIAAVSNAVVEASVCGVRVRDEAKTMVTEMIARAGER